MQDQIVIIKDIQGVRDLISYLEDKDFVACDTETTGVKKDSEIIGLSICASPGIGYYVITNAWDCDNKRLNRLETLEMMPELCRALAHKDLIFHNAVFDCSMIWNNYKVQLIESVHTDTMILAHLLDENRRVGLKELGAAYYGASAKKEQEEMLASITANGGEITKENYELYKADADLIAKYGAKDAILTYNIFFELVPDLEKDNLIDFFYKDESMPLLRGPTYQMNTEGLKVDTDKLAILKKTLEVEILELEGFIYKEIDPIVKETYLGDKKSNQFNIGSGSQLAWLLFDQLGNTFPKLSDAGREMWKSLGNWPPRTKSDKEVFIAEIKMRKGDVWREKGKIWDPKTHKYKGEGKIRDYWAYLSTDATVLKLFSKKYHWIEKLLEHKKLIKLLSTYVLGIEEGLQYGIIRPSFLQHGTTSGRYSSRHPNFQNLPRDDKRVKACIVARPGKVFVGADYSQLEPRVFASMSGDERLLRSFKDGDDFYSVIGVEVFDRHGCSLKKEDKNSFAELYPKERQISKTIGLAATYGASAFQLAGPAEKSVDETKEIIFNYFERFPSVRQFQLKCHNEAKTTGQVLSYFGRPRRLPQAKLIVSEYGDLPHDELPYEIRNILNLAVNHEVQGTGASTINRASIAFCNICKEMEKEDIRWREVSLILQVHDELVAESPIALAQQVSQVLKIAMEETISLPGIDLIAEPKIAYNLADLK